MLKLFVFVSGCRSPAPCVSGRFHVNLNSGLKVRVERIVGAMTSPHMRCRKGSVALRADASLCGCVCAEANSINFGPKRKHRVELCTLSARQIPELLASHNAATDSGLVIAGGMFS